VSRILGLDVGERRIGIAISDPEGRVAVPLRILERASGGATEQAIGDLARVEGVVLIVLGLPLSMDGTVGQQAQLVQAFGETLARATGLAVAYWDERLSSVQAERTGAGSRKRAVRHRRGGRTPRDDVAAAIILQAYLDRQRARGEPEQLS